MGDKLKWTALTKKIGNKLRLAFLTKANGSQNKVGSPHKRTWKTIED